MILETNFQRTSIIISSLTPGHLLIAISLDKVKKRYLQDKEKSFTKVCKIWKAKDKKIWMYCQIRAKISEKSRINAQ